MDQSGTVTLRGEGPQPMPMPRVGKMPRPPARQPHEEFGVNRARRTPGGATVKLGAPPFFASLPVKHEPVSPATTFTSTLRRKNLIITLEQV